MALIEAGSAERHSRTSLTALVAGRILPHALIAGYVMVSLAGAVSTVDRWIWLYLLAYGATTAAVSYAARRRLRFSLVAAGVAAALVVTGGALRLFAPAGEATAYVSGILLFFLWLALGVATVTSYCFIASRWYYIVEVALLNLCWIALVIARSEGATGTLLLRSLPVVAYSLYVMLFDYTLAPRLDADGRRRVILRFAAVLLFLLIAMLFGYIGGTGGSASGSARSYSLMSSKNDLYVMDERAKLEDEFRIPLDSKELVFVARIEPLVVNGAPARVGYYLKFHSLYEYDAVASEFHTLADDMEDARFRLRRVALAQTLLEPAQLTVDLDGRDIVPPYAERVEGVTTVYNVKLQTDQSFGHNLSYRLVSYPTRDSITVGDRSFPLLGIHKLFTRVSLLNVIPIGTSGQFFQFDYNALVLDRIRQYGDAGQAPLSFTQRYLNLSGLEQDIIDTARAATAGAGSVAEKVQAVIAWFTRRGSDGRRAFVYDLKPGKPPAGESPLHHFLLTTRRAYCTYYAAAATLFFRAVGIPARVAIGFVPGEASEQNPDWYYIYSQQGHAWTEVYLGPSLGWIDVDLTPAGENSENLPPPPPPPTPPTPPMPLEPQYQLRGTVLRSGDRLACSSVRVTRRDEAADADVCLPPAGQVVSLHFDAAQDPSVGVSEQRRQVTETVARLSPGDSVQATGAQARNPGLETGQIESFTFHRIERVTRRAGDSARAAQQRAGGTSLWRSPWLYGALGMLLHLLFLSIPSLHLAALRRRTRSAADGMKRIRAARSWVLLALHMQGWPSERETDLEYAARMSATLGTPLAAFFECYLRCRYLGSLDSDPRALCDDTIAGIRDALRQRRNVLARMLRRANLWQYMRHINRRRTA